MRNPTLSLVGAGPGDPELITLKAIKTIRAASVILYDAFVIAICTIKQPFDHYSG